MPPDKTQLFAAVLASLEAELAAVERVAAMARDEATSEETRSEGKYDTRATEASYLARGQAVRVAELRGLCAWFREREPLPSEEGVALGSVVRVSGPRPGWLLLAPAGGPAVEVGGVPVRLISPDSPLGRAMLGIEQGEGFEVEGPQGIASYVVEDLL
jgi:hypothetical protein